jgi:hypothetical protein
MKKIYGYPVLPKAGLANMLIPWAECYLWCYDNGFQQIAPFWGKLRLGPYIRGERDRRKYQKLFKAGNRITGLSRLLLLLTSKKIPFEEFHLRKDKNNVRQSTLVCFSDMNHLERLIGRDKEILNELYQITRPEYLPTELPSAYIGIHIRMGDFPFRNDENKNGFFRLPIEWYIEALKQLRLSLGKDIPAFIFSDGTYEELYSILNVKNTIRSPLSESISDLLALSASSVIITSRSSFSLIGAFLGQVPSIWYPGKKDICRSGYMPKEQSMKLEVEWMPGQTFCNEFIDALNKRIQ